MLSIIITVLNENNYILNKTIESIINSVPQKEVEIILVNDYSDKEPIIENKKVTLISNSFRMGVAQSRHLGAAYSNNKWLLFTDGHMKFDKDWYNNFLEYSRDSDYKTVYNGTCLGFWEKYDENIDLNKLPHYYGARLSLYEEKEKQILEAKWIYEQKDQDNYEISCLMGAIYFIQKDYFFNLRGLSDLKGWGSDEPNLSLKILQSGGKIKQIKNVKAAHLFRKSAPYSTENKFMIYNKIRMANTLLPDNIGSNLIDKLNKDINYYNAIQLIDKEKKQIHEYKNYYKSILHIDLKDICKKYNIDIINE